MNKQKLIEALEMVIEAIKEDDSVSTVAPAKEVKKAPAKKEEAPVMNEPEETPVEAGDIDVESLKKMKYNDFKKYASTLGVDCKGTRDEIMNRILALGTVETPVEEEPKQEEPTKSDKPASSKKLGKAKTTEPARDEFDEQAEEIAKETSVEDIIEALADVGIKATKKNAVEKLAYALRENPLSLDDDYNEYEESEEDEDTEAEQEESDEEAEDEADEEEITATVYTPEYDPNGYNDPETMSDARKEAVTDKMQEILDSIESEDLGEEDIESYIQDNATDAEIELLGDEYEDEDLIKFYMELVKRTIDNDGEEHEPADPYEMGDNNMCCGHELKYSKKTKKYICEHCGTEYEAE